MKKDFTIITGVIDDKGDYVRVRVSPTFKYITLKRTRIGNPEALFESNKLIEEHQKHIAQTKSQKLETSTEKQTDPVQAAPLKEVSVLISRQGEQMGPYALSKAQQMAQDGLILETDYAWYEGLDNWIPAMEVMGTVQQPASAHCPKCSAVVDADSPFCMECGVKLSQ